MDESKGQADVSANELTVKDVDTLLGLFRKLRVSNFPSKNKRLWKRCEKEAEKELLEKLREQESRLTFRPGKNVSIHTRQPEQQKADRQAIEGLILAGAEKKYREEDRVYGEAVDRKKKNIPAIVKDIDCAHYPIREQLLKFGRTKDTLLGADFRQIMDYVTIEEIIQPNFQYLVEKTIDALEPIKIVLKRQRLVSSKKTDTPKIEGERSKPMSKSKMMAALNIDSYKTFNAWAKDKEMKPAGNRQTFTIRLDVLDPKTRQKLEKA